jgi:carboxylesterase type B
VLSLTILRRLNALGFLSLESDQAPGNLGLRDVALALKWVRQNIEAFGGKSDQITLQVFIQRDIRLRILIG